MEKRENTIAGYRILSELGRGTTGVVYKARNTYVATDRDVSLRMLALTGAEDATRRQQRFLREARVLAHLTWEPDPNIPSLFEVGEHDIQIFCVREFIEGKTLEELDTDKSFEFHQGVSILATLADVVQRIHNKGFAHRNLLPANILISKRGVVKLIGFGNVGLLTGSDHLPPGSQGTSPDVDVRSLQMMLGWLCANFPQTHRSGLEEIQQPGAVASPSAFAEALRCCYRFTGNS